MERGTKLTYIKNFMFGKTSKVTVTVVAINGNKVLVDSGETLNLIDLQLNNKN